MTRIALTVNGKPITAEVEPRTHLADFLREQLLLTGTHIGCEHGICGACTVELNGEIARSCITYAVSCDGADVRTIESFDDDAAMARLRQAFSEEHALQCGYCTPGMLIAARDLVRRKTGLSRGEIRTEMSGNLCRCTGYVGIISAIERLMADGGTERIQAAAAIQWLGPAPGPAASDARVPSPALPASGAEAHLSVPRSSNASSTRAPIRIDVGPIEDVDGATRLTQSFVLPHAREAVWALMSDPLKIARCLPGMSLDGPPEGDRVKGRLEVKIGPIAASFAGDGKLTQIPADYRQIIEGEGGDHRSRSRVSGRVDYRLLPVAGDTQATRVDATIAYTLTGTLAQIGRSAIVRDLARRIGESFAHNVDGQLINPGAPIQATKLGMGRLIVQVVAGRIRTAIAGVLGRR
jgi:aerobic carbon-monoxide dehydrogenase small subunit